MADRPNDFDRNSVNGDDRRRPVRETGDYDSLGARIGARRPPRAPDPGLGQSGSLPRPGGRGQPPGWTPYGEEPTWRRREREAATAAAAAAAPPPQLEAPLAPMPVVESPRSRWSPALVLALVIAGAAIGIGAFAAGRAVGTTVREVQIPVMRGQDLSTANNVMQSLGLQTVLAPPVFDNQIQVNSVVGTSPPAGTNIRLGEVVTITYSNGAEPVGVPPLAGQPEPSARTALGQVGLTPGLRLTEASREVPAGSVIRTEPEVGANVPPNSPITLVVSSGPPPVVIPRVIGLTEQEARNQLDEAGLEPEVTTRAAQADAEVGRVVEQTPEAGTVADPGASVSITVAG
jgi:eukaryotic-like serine/threonine-protein kinase